MGINIQTLKLLLHENSYLPIYGRVLLIGRSTVTISDDRIIDLLNFHKINPLPLLKNQKSGQTRHSVDSYYLDDVTLFEALSDKIDAVDVLDVSDYEGATITADLNYPIPKEFWNRYDFIYDSSVLDNIFNPAEALLNVSRLLRSNGRVLHLHHTSFFPGSMVACHPEWFYGFYACNGFKDVKLYLAEQTSLGWNRFEFETNLYSYSPVFSSDPEYNRFLGATNKRAVYYSLILAESGKNLAEKELNFPTNLQYISTSNAFDWTVREKQFSSSKRPLVAFDDKLNCSKKVSELPLGTDHFRLVAEKF
jgi:SAM-dependent methyltransferase